MRCHLSVFIALFSVLCFPVQAQAQSRVGAVHVGSVDSGMGIDAAGIGDVDGDGCDDIVVGGAESNGGIGQALVLSGCDGSIIHTLNGMAAGDIFGQLVSGAGDLNNDGVPDLAIASLGNIQCFSGLDGSLLLQFSRLASLSPFSLPGDLLPIGDADGDGIGDLVLSTPGSDLSGASSGRVDVFSGSDGQIIASAPGLITADRFGNYICPVDDRDGDGCADIVATSEATNTLRIVSSQDGSLIQAISLPTGAVAFGVHGLAGGGDFDGDGHSDIAVRIDIQTLAIYSGADGSLITNRFLTQPRQYDNGLAFVGDWNGDGFDDLAAMEYNNFIGKRFVTVFAGPNGSRIESFDTRLFGQPMYTGLHSAGDANGDGTPDLIVHNPYAFGVMPNQSNGSGLTQIAYGPGPVLRHVYPLGHPNALALNWIPDNGSLHDITGRFAFSGASPFASGTIVGSLGYREVVQLGYLPLPGRPLTFLPHLLCQLRLRCDGQAHRPGPDAPDPPHRRPPGPRADLRDRALARVLERPRLPDPALKSSRN